MIAQLLTKVTVVTPALVHVQTLSTHQNELGNQTIFIGCADTVSPPRYSLNSDANYSSFNRSLIIVTYHTGNYFKVKFNLKRGWMSMVRFVPCYNGK
jgi:hypothetical protein